MKEELVNFEAAERSLSDDPAFTYPSGVASFCPSTVLEYVISVKISIGSRSDRSFSSISVRRQVRKLAWKFEVSGANRGSSVKQRLERIDEK